MPILPDGALSIKLPSLVKVTQLFDSNEIVDIEAAVMAELNTPYVEKLVKPGQNIAIAVGSRGISNIVRIVKILGDRLKDFGATPFVIPAMGSHGGATAAGQRDVLESLGISEDTVGMAIVSSMEVCEIGKTADGVPVYTDKNAVDADMVIPVARIKPHTDFRGNYESGLCKMLAIGLGKHSGCSRLHQEGFSTFDTLLPQVAKVVIEKTAIGFGLAIVENAYDKTFKIRMIPANEFFTEEPQLLLLAKKKMATIMVPDIDVLIVEQIGKDISGAGMDPNIIGRTSKGKLAGFNGPSIQRIVVLDLSDATHGNACGIGLADFITRRAYDKIDYLSTYANVIASANPEAGRVPVVMDNEREAVIAAVRCCKTDQNQPRIVRITDTLHLGQIEVSENLLPVIKTNQNIKICRREMLNEA